MSKKLAAGAEAIVLDVKVGDGAFMKTLEDARALAETMVELGRRAGREVVCLLTDMDQPLGRAVGNALEIREAIATRCAARGRPTSPSSSSTRAARLLALSDLGVDLEEGRARAERAVAGRLGARAYERWIRAQGGDPDEAALPEAPVVRQVAAPADGHRRRARRDPDRPRGAPPRRRAGRSRTTRSTMPSGSSAFASVATRCELASRSPRSTRATRRAPSCRRRGARRARDRRGCSPSAEHRARDNRLTPRHPATARRPPRSTGSARV